MSEHLRHDSTRRAPPLLAGADARTAALAGSEAAAAIAELDWAATPLGPMTDWPAALQSTLRLVLASPLPLALWWGPQLLALHNDAFAALPPAGHPWSLGHSARTTWSEDWERLGSAADAVLRLGCTSRHALAGARDLELALSPCFDDAGRVAGVLVAALPAPAHGSAAPDAASLPSDRPPQPAAVPDGWQALRDNEQRLREMAEAMPQIVYVTCPDGRMEYINRRWQDYTGRSGMAATDLQAVIHPQDLPALVAAWRRSAQAGAPLAAEFRMRGADGEYRWFLTRAVAVRDEAGRIQRWYGTSTDVDDSRRNAEALAQAHATLQQIERRKDQFIATLAHELRNPLAPLRNGVQLLGMGVGGDGSVRVQAMMRRQIDQLVRLVDDLLEVSRITSGKVVLQRAPLDLADVLHAAAETARPLLEQSRHTLVMDTGAVAARRIDGDAMRLAQVFANLLNNAAKYTDAGGRITLMARLEHEGLALVQVQDNGVGLAPGMLEEVFQPFVQADRSAARAQGGLGIGLSLVRSLVELHGGSVRASSPGPGRGSTFEVRLPLLPATLGPGDTLPPAPEPLPRCAGGPTVLVVDDNRDAADSLGYMLEMMGAQVRVVYGGPDAVAAVEAEPPALVLLDLGMPGMDGFQVVRRLARHRARDRMQVVALTGWGQNEDRQRTREAGFDEHLVKPAAVDRLEALLAQAAQGA